jgi:hypothetical protein
MMENVMRNSVSGAESREGEELNIAAEYVQIVYRFRHLCHVLFG